MENIMFDANNHRTDSIEEMLRLKIKLDDVDKELGDVKSRLNDRSNEVKDDLKNDIKEVKSDLKDDLQIVKSDLKGDLQSLKEDLNNRISRLETRLRSNVTITVAIGSIVTSAVVALIVAFLN